MKKKKKQTGYIWAVVLLCLAVAVLTSAVCALAFVKIKPTPLPPPTPEITVAPPTPSPTPMPTPVPTPDPELLALEQLRKEQEKENEFLTLVNPWNPLQESFSPEVESLYVDWQYFVDSDVRCSEALMEMYHACQEAGCNPYITSAYRTYWMQFDLYQNKIIRCILEDGFSEEEAPVEAAKQVAVPGTSEHELGLAFDIIDFEYTNLDDEQENTATQQWLMKHCWEYGFILRYPNGTSNITGIIYEPWHYRYVGKVAAKAISERGITLEEYLQLIYPDRVYGNADNIEELAAARAAEAEEEQAALQVQLAQDATLRAAAEARENEQRVPVGEPPDATEMEALLPGMGAFIGQ